MFSPTSVCRLVGQQDDTKTSEQISTKLGWKMSLGPEWTPLTSGANPEGFPHFKVVRDGYFQLLL